MGRRKEERVKQKAACVLLNLALIEENKSSIRACGAIPPWLSHWWGWMMARAGMMAEKARAGMMAEKAMVVLSSLAANEEGREAIVEEGGIAALAKAIEDGSAKGKNSSDPCSFGIYS
ncbi:hypothetical protein OIU78_002827 [Salix suchowensis]|nr:hypothetical protein OIU78_002827 [Salix suchowensis]